MDDPDRVFLWTTQRLAPPSLARADARVALTLLAPALAAGGPLADLGCGYGRHLAALQAEAAGRGRALIGVDRSALLLREAARQAPSARLVRADLRALPLADGSLAAAACFYSSLFLGTHEDARAGLAEARRALGPRGLLLLTTDNPLRLRARPSASFRDEVPGLGLVSEESAFDAAAGVDVVRRRVELVAPATGGGEAMAGGPATLEAEFRIRYYEPPALAALAASAGLHLLRLWPDQRLSPEADQLVALLSAAKP